MNETSPQPASETNIVLTEAKVQIPEPEKEVDLNLLFPGEEKDLNQLFPDAEMKELLKKVSKNKKDLHLMVDRFTEITETE
jgi:hypothetical protein